MLTVGQEPPSSPGPTSCPSHSLAPLRHHNLERWDQTSSWRPQPPLFIPRLHLIPEMSLVAGPPSSPDRGCFQKSAASAQAWGREGSPRGLGLLGPARSTARRSLAAPHWRCAKDQLWGKEVPMGSICQFCGVNAPPTRMSRNVPTRRLHGPSASQLAPPPVPFPTSSLTLPSPLGGPFSVCEA